MATMTAAERQRILHDCVQCAAGLQKVAGDLRKRCVDYTGDEIPIPRAAVEAVAKTIAATAIVVDELVTIVETYQGISNGK